MDDTQNKSNSPIAKIALYIVGILIVLAIGYYVFSEERKELLTEEESSTLATTTVNVGGVTMQLPPGVTATVEMVGEKPSIPAPSTSRPLVFPPSLSDPEARTLVAQKIGDVRSEIEENPYNYRLWLSLGVYWNMLEDYEGARLAWEYASAIAPQDYTAYSNLGFLYGYVLKDQTKAVLNFRKSVEFAGSADLPYGQAFEYYRDVAKDFAKAREVAEKGLLASGNKDFFNSLLNTLE